LAWIESRSKRLYEERQSLAMILALAINDPKKLVEISERQSEGSADIDAPGAKWWSPEGQAP
jgi:hypothetical protein